MTSRLPKSRDSCVDVAESELGLDTVSRGAYDRHFENACELDCIPFTAYFEIPSDNRYLAQ